MGRLPYCRSALLVLACLAAGCGDKFHPVAGKVTLGGKPFAHGSVNLVPVGEGRPAFGGTDAEGRFTLDTGNSHGAPKGTYKLVLQKYDTPVHQDETTPGEQRLPMKSAVPARYSKPETSDVTVEVPSPSGTYEFDLPDK